MSVIVPTYHKIHRLDLMLRSLLGAIDDGVEIIVVDDGGRNIKPILAGFPEVRLIEIPHGGRSVARNRGAQAACGHRLLFLDDDVLVEPGMLSIHIDPTNFVMDVIIRGAIRHLPWLAPFDDPIIGTLTPAAQNSLGGAAGSLALMDRRLQVDDRGRLRIDLHRQSRLSRFERDIQSCLAHIGPWGVGRWIGLSGAHFSIGREVFLGLGGFDERMGIRWGAEDLELGFRAEKLGLPLFYSTDAVVHHMDHDQSNRRGDHQVALEYFADKHAAPSVLRLLEYFEGRCSLEEAISK